MNPFCSHWTKKLALFAVVLAVAPSIPASIRGPYAADANTIILLHLDEASPVGLATNSVAGANFIAAAHSTSASPRNPTPGILGGPGAAGAGFDFGKCANLTFSNSVGLFIDGNQNGVADLDVGAAALGDDVIPMASFCGPSGEFTLEALINLPSLSGANREIVCMDTSGSPRPFQFRITSSGQIEFNNIGTSGANPKVSIPITGPEAFVAGQWFHVALTYDGAGTINIYWTKLDNARTGATLLQSFTDVPALVETGSAVLTIGNENRNISGEGLAGYIDEVRISNVARGATDLAFNTQAAAIPPAIDPPPADQFLGVGEKLEIQSHASGSPVLQYQWQKSDGASFTNLPGQTGDSLSLPVTFATAGDYRYLVNNSYGSATSSVARITVGAVFCELFRTGFDEANTQLADGLPDPHYTLWSSSDPLNLGPATIACPVTDTTYNANDEGSRWISPYAALGGVRGVFTYRATFLVDAAVPTGAALSATILAAGPTTVLLNGQPTGVANLTPAFPGPFRNLFAFTLTNGFVAGLNTLDFVVDNGTNAVNPVYGNALRITSVRGIGAALAPGIPTLSHPQNQRVRDGGMARFSTVAAGRPPLRYQWYSDGSPLPDATNRVLVLNPVAAGLQGTQFKVVVGNDSGSVTSQVAMLTLVPANQPPLVTSNLVVTAFGGGSVAIPMSALVQNASDPDGDLVTMAGFDATGTNGVSPATITEVGATYVYANSASFIGTDRFDVVLFDGLDGYATNHVTVKFSDLTIGIGYGPAGSLRLAWPATATSLGYQPLAADLITSPLTNTVLGSVVNEGTENALYVNPTNGARFYRLGNP